MSSGVDVQRRPGIWSYFSFNSTHRRRASSLTAGSLPTRNSAKDPFEKPDRHAAKPSNGSYAGLMHDVKTASMNQGQRTRYLKAGGLIALVLMIFWFWSPGKTYISTSRALAHKNFVEHLC
jgi:guanosine-diphosphatase